MLHTNKVEVGNFKGNQRKTRMRYVIVASRLVEHNERKCKLKNSVKVDSKVRSIGIQQTTL